MHAHSESWTIEIEVFITAYSVDSSHRGIPRYHRSWTSLCILRPIPWSLQGLYCRFRYLGSLSLCYVRWWSVDSPDIEGSLDIDSDLLRMDSSSDSDGPDMPFMKPSSYDFSQQSSGRSEFELRLGQFVKLIVPHFEEVGIGSVVDVHPSRQWLCVTILAFSTEFIPVRPSTIDHCGQRREPLPRTSPERLQRFEGCSELDSSLESC